MHMLFWPTLAVRWTALIKCLLKSTINFLQCFEWRTLREHTLKKVRLCITQQKLTSTEECVSPGEWSFHYSHSSSYMINVQNMSLKFNIYWEETIRAESVLNTWNKWENNLSSSISLHRYCVCDILSPNHSSIWRTF